MNLGSPFFTIIIPVYNGAKYINAVLHELFEQTISSFELIIVDDGSTDDTEVQIQPYLSDSRIRYFRQSNKGVSAARNKGVKHANGKFLIFLDCDDHPYPNLVEEYYNCILQNPESFLFCAQFHNQGKLKGLRLNSYVFNLPISVNAGSYCISKKLFLDVGGFDEDMSHSENWELFLRIGLYPNIKPNNITCITKPVLNYTAVYSTHKLLTNKVNKIKSYSALYEKHQNRLIYSSIRLSYFAQVVANNYAGLGDFKNLIKWTMKSVYTYPFNLKNYYKPLFIFIKRRIIPYP
jgi:glycosyltransferase involved in cell wall biosynthesis